MNEQYVLVREHAEHVRNHEREHAELWQAVEALREGHRELRERDIRRAGLLTLAPYLALALQGLAALWLILQ